MGMEIKKISDVVKQNKYNLVSSENGVLVWENPSTNAICTAKYIGTSENGVNYYLFDNLMAIPYARMAQATKVSIEKGSSVTNETVLKWVSTIESRVDSITPQSATDLSKLYSTINSIRQDIGYMKGKIADNETAYMCDLKLAAIYIVTENEDINIYDDLIVSQKMSDWENDYFFFASLVSDKVTSSIEAYNTIFQFFTEMKNR